MDVGAPVVIAGGEVHKGTKWYWDKYNKYYTLKYGNTIIQIFS